MICPSCNGKTIPDPYSEYCCQECGGTGKLIKESEEIIQLKRDLAAEQLAHNETKKLMFELVSAWSQCDGYPLRWLEEKTKKVLSSLVIYI